MVHGFVGVLLLLFLKGKYNILNCPKVKTKSPTPSARGDGFPGAMAPAQGRGCEALSVSNEKWVCLGGGL